MAATSDDLLPLDHEDGMSLSGLFRQRRLRLEKLEDRRMLAVITVTSAGDDLVVDGMVTLREAIQASNTDSSVDGSTIGSGADTIEFAPSLSGQTIALGGTHLDITDALTIDASALEENVAIDANQQSRIFLIDDPNTESEEFDVLLTSLTLTNGRVTGDSAPGGAILSRTLGQITLTQALVLDNETDAVSSGSGGGIFSSGNLTLNESRIQGNTTNGLIARGGGIYSQGEVELNASHVTSNTTHTTVPALPFSPGGGIFAEGAVTIIDSTVSGNEAAGRGGGVHAEQLDVLVTNSSVSNNVASDDGGAVYAGQIVVQQSEVSGNRTSESGGGLFGQVTLSESVLINNIAMDYGGGILTGAPVSITDSVMSGNDARTGGALASLGSVPVVFTRSTISDNTAEFEGGGIWSRCAPIELIQSTLSGNTASQGGGAHSRCGAMIINQSTITRNYASTSGGGLSGFQSNYGYTTSIENSVIAGNTAAASHPDIDPRGFDSFAPAVNHTLIGDTSDTGIDATTGTGNLLNIDPLLGPLADNGGPILPDGSEPQTHALLPGSPLLDVLALQFSTDQRGGAAPVDLIGIDNGGTGDIGAYEAQAIPSAEFTSDGAVSGSDFLTWQRGFGLTDGATSADGDSDHDGDVDASDLAAWQASYGLSANAALAANAADLLNEPKSPSVASTATSPISAAANLWLDLQQTHDSSKTREAIAHDTVFAEDTALTTEVLFTNHLIDHQQVAASVVENGRGSRAHRLGIAFESNAQPLESSEFVVDIFDFERR